MVLEVEDSLVPVQTTYALKPSLTQIKVLKLPSGTYNPSTFTLTCGIVMNEGGTVSSYNDRTTALDGYNIYFRLRARDSQTWPSTYDRYGYAENHTAIASNGLPVASYDAVEFILCKNTANSISALNVTDKYDAITVSILADGEGGKPAAILAMSPDRIEVPADKNGVSTQTVTVTAYIKMTVGGTLQSGATVSEASESLSGVTVSKFSDRVRIVVASGTAMTDYAGFVLVTAQVTVDGVSYTAYATIVISASRKGADGTLTERVYLSNAGGTPSTPSGSSPSGWSATKTAISSVYRYRWVSERTSNDDGSTWTAWSAPVIDAYLGKDGTSFTIKGLAIGVATGSQTCADVCTAAGVTPVSGNIVLQNGSECTEYDILVYSGSAWVASSDSISVNDGYITRNGHLWVRTSSTVYSERWSDCGQIKGDKGDPGDDAVVYQLHVTPGIVTVDPDGNFSTDDIVVTKTRTEGDVTTDVSGFTLRFQDENGTYVSLPVAGTTFSYSIPMILFFLSNSSPKELLVIDDDGTNAQPVTVGFVYEHTGKTGRMFYLAGEYSATTTYTRNDKVCPIVHNGDKYWYLDADSALGQEPNDDSEYWEEAEHFGIVITEALFAAFAKLGSFVVSGDYFISQYGALFVNGSKVAVKASRTVGYVYMKTVNGVSIPYYAATSDADADMPCYTYFVDSDPTAESTSPAFRPTKIVDGRTGAEWMAGGKIHVSQDGDLTVRGTVKADNLYHGTCIWRQEAKPWYRVSVLSEQMAAAGLAVGDYVQSADITAEYTDAMASDMYISGSDYNFIMCSGPADVVILPYTSSQNDRFVTLPSPAEFEGKIVEIYDCHWATTRDYYVRIAAPINTTNRGFARGIYSTGPTSGGSYDIDTRTYQDKARYISIKYNDSYWWLRLG